MVVPDCCYSGTLTRSASVGLRVAMVSSGLEPVEDNGGGGNSTFARAFLDALSDNPDIIDGTRLFAAIRMPVILDGKQTPEYSDVRDSGHDGGDFLFVPK
jgi:hypothetical protein